jgi:hypothetical protein
MVYVCSLFDNAFSVAQILNCRVKGRWKINWKGSGSKRSWPNFKVLSRHSPEETEENHKNFSHDNRSRGRDINPGPLEYKAGMLTTWLDHDVQFHIVAFHEHGLN